MSTQQIQNSKTRKNMNLRHAQKRGILSHQALEHYLEQILISEKFHI